MTTGLKESELLDLLSGQLQAALQQLRERPQVSEQVSEELSVLLPELGQALAQALAAALHANNQRIAEQAARSGSESIASRADFYDHLSACIDGY